MVEQPRLTCIYEEREQTQLETGTDSPRQSLVSLHDCRKEPLCEVGVTVWNYALSMQILGFVCLEKYLRAHGTENAYCLHIPLWRPNGRSQLCNILQGEERDRRVKALEETCCAVVDDHRG